MNPNALDISSASTTTFQYRTQTGGTYPNQTVISANTYDNNGVLIRNIYTGKMYKGTYTYTSDLSDHTEGMCYGVLKTQKEVKSNKIIKIN